MPESLKLTFDERKVQGTWFHLTTVDSRLNQLVGLHHHDFAEICWMDAGSCGQQMNGQYQQLQQGDLMLLRPHDSHQMFEEQRPFRFTNLSLAPSLYRELQQRYPEEWQALYQHEQPLCLHLGTAELETMQAEARRLAALPHTRLAVEHMISGIWLRCLQQNRSGSHSSIPDWLQQALIRIEESDVFRHGVPGFIQVCGRSAEHVSRMCKQHLQQTPSQIVNQARMRYAAFQLRMTSRSVESIASECGFEDPGRFYRLFKQHYGTTPRRYRSE